MRVVITGAAGEIGGQVVEELSPSHEVRLIDRRPVRGRKSLIADLSRNPAANGLRSCFRSKRSRWSDAFEDADVVVHLAAEIHTTAPWERVLSDNVEGMWNVLQTAAEHRVARVVFASSNWAVKALEQKLAPDCYLANGPKIASDAPAAPLTPYGLSKAFGEIMGRTFVDEKRLRSFIAVRIGSYRPEPPTDEHLLPRWIGSSDIRGLLRRCVEADFDGFHVVYGVSAQPTVPYDLSHTRRLLGWVPTQLPEPEIRMTVRT